MASTVSRPRASRVAAATIFHALSDETRLAVIEMLRGGERCVCDLQDAVGAAQSRLSFHLKVLKDAGLVTDRKEGRWSYYALDPDRIEEARSALGVLATPVPAVARPLQLHALERAPRSTPSSATRAARRGRARAMADGGENCC